MSLRDLLREVLPDSMGGYPDLFCPSGGWEAWEERAKAALASEEEDGAPAVKVCRRCEDAGCCPHYTAPSPAPSTGTADAAHGERARTPCRCGYPAGRHCTCGGDCCGEPEPVAAPAPEERCEALPFDERLCVCGDRENDHDSIACYGSKGCGCREYRPRPSPGEEKQPAAAHGGERAVLGLCSSAAYDGIPHVKCHDCVGWEPVPAAAPSPEAEDLKWGKAGTLVTADLPLGRRICVSQALKRWPNGITTPMRPTRWHWSLEQWPVPLTNRGAKILAEGVEDTVAGAKAAALAAFRAAAPSPETEGRCACVGHEHLSDRGDPKRRCWAITPDGGRCCPCQGAPGRSGGEAMSDENKMTHGGIAFGPAATDEDRARLRRMLEGIPLAHRRGACPACDDARARLAAAERERDLAVSELHQTEDARRTTEFRAESAERQRDAAEYALSEQRLIAADVEKERRETRDLYFATLQRERAAEVERDAAERRAEEAERERDEARANTTFTKAHVMTMKVRDLQARAEAAEARLRECEKTLR